MGYTNSPSYTTHETQKVPACFTISSRDFSYSVGLVLDAGMVNLLPTKSPEKNNADLYAETRPAVYGSVLETSSAFVRGVYVWEKTSALTYYYAVAGVKVFTSTDGFTWTAVTTLATASNNPVGFTEFIDSTTNTKSLVLVDGIEGWVYTSNAAGTKITDANFPTPHLPTPIYLDGYLLLAKTNTGDIYNSNLNTPSAWTAGNFISSELYPDDVRALVKVNNYMLAVGSQGCEYFYDAGIATGSPFARQGGASLPFGCTIPFSIASNKNTVVMLANNNDGGVTLKVIEDFKTRDISPNWLMTLLPSSTTLLGTGPASIRGFFLRYAGDLFYVLRLGASSATDPNYATFAYSFNTDMWIELKSGSAGFAASCSCAGTGTNIVSFVGGNYFSVTPNSFPFFGTFGQSSVFSTMGGGAITPRIARDQLYNNATALMVYTDKIYTEIRTALMTFGNIKIKTMSRFGIEFTGKSYLGPLSEVFSVYHSDDDYNTWSAVRTLNGSGDFPFITQLGAFRQRAFKVTFKGDTNILYKFFEVDINKGVQ